ncbi:hypothetical protein TNCV_5062501 [Trichonephila clavipes]|nr:hypothetical protein TNCV_5062501 [Trichonephila clavipes]
MRLREVLAKTSGRQRPRLKIASRLRSGFSGARAGPSHLRGKRPAHFLTSKGPTPIISDTPSSASPTCFKRPLLCALNAKPHTGSPLQRRPFGCSGRKGIRKLNRICFFPLLLKRNSQIHPNSG